MTDPRASSDVSAFARARRFLGRVLDTVRGSEPPSAHVAESTRGASLRPPSRPLVVPVIERASGATRARPARSSEASPPSPELRAAREAAQGLLAEGDWSGLRVEDTGRGALVAWRGLEGVSVLRTVEVHCALGALDARPEVRVRDQRIDALGATSLESDALRWIVALGKLVDGEFVSVTHTALR